MTDDDFFRLVIQALLMLIDAIERWRGYEPRTCELRKRGKQKDGRDATSQ